MQPTHAETHINSEIDGNTHGNTWKYGAGCMYSTPTHAHIDTQTQMHTHTSTPLGMVHSRTQTFADTRVYPDTPVCPCSPGRTLAGTGPWLLAHSSAACRPHCPAGPPPPPIHLSVDCGQRAGPEPGVGAGPVEAAGWRRTRLGRGGGRMTLDAWEGGPCPAPG